MEAIYHDYELAPPFSQVSTVYSRFFSFFFNLRSHHNGIPLPENKTFSGLFGSNRIFTVKQVLVALGRKTDGLLDGSENS